MIRHLIVLLCLPLAGAVAQDTKAQEEEPKSGRWRFTFRNGDRVHCRLKGIRDGLVMLRFEGAPTTSVSVRLRDVQVATRAIALEEEAALVVGTTPRAEPPGAEILRMRDGTVLLGRFRSITGGKIEFEVASIGIIHLDGGEVAEFLPTEEVVRAYYRSLSAPTSAVSRPLSPRRFEVYWSDLASKDNNRAWRARRALLRSGVATLPLLRERLKWQPDAPKRMRLLARLLDSDDVVIRQMAHAKLHELGRASEGILREALKQTQSPEVRGRTTAILESFGMADDMPLSPELVRVLRAIDILEEMATPEAKAILDELAASAPTAQTTREAQLALERLKLGD